MKRRASRLVLLLGHVVLAAVIVGVHLIAMTGSGPRPSASASKGGPEETPPGDGAGVEAAPAAGSVQDRGKEATEVQMEVERVVIPKASDQQVVVVRDPEGNEHRVTLPAQTTVVLREKGGDRSFPIIIGRSEAAAIDRGLKGTEFPRPLTHDLLEGVIRRMGGELRRVVVNELKGGTFHARLHVARNGEEIEVDARPSDAIALAVRAGCPVFVEGSVLDEVEGGQAAGPRVKFVIPGARSGPGEPESDTF